MTPKSKRPNEPKRIKKNADEKNLRIPVAFFLTPCYNRQRCEKYGPVAQLGECYIRIVEVESSNLFRSTKKEP